MSCTSLHRCESRLILMYMIGTQCVENSIQLVSELSQSECYVLICLDGAWGEIEYGNAAAATVACRQLGFSTES